MSLTTGVSHPTAGPLPTEKLRFQGDSSPAVSRGAGGPVGILGSLARGIGNLRTPGQSVENLFLNTAKEGPMAIVPLESAVIVGRSERAYRRDGLLELQERMTEEIAAAVVWLYGVGFLQKHFEKVSHKLNPGKNEHLSTHIAWNQPWAKTTHVDLSPQEMFARNKKEINVLLGLKSARWLFSVGSALVAVGYLIPKGNQLKTNLILKHLERRKRAAEGSNVQFGDPRRTLASAGAPLSGGQTLSPQASRFAPTALPFFSAASSAPSDPNPSLPLGNSNPSTFYSGSNSLNHTVSTGNSPFHSNRSNSQAVSPFQINPVPLQAQPVHSVNPSAPVFGLATPSPTMPGMNVNPTNANPLTRSSGVRFGGGLPGLSMVQGMGHLVEQTPYGSILVVDAGIAGGRGYVASKRSPYETAEVLFRDIGSLYFYILCVPHLMKLMSSTIDPLFKSSSQLQPKVATLLHEELKSVTTPAALTNALHGAGEFMMAPEGQLRQALRLADEDALKRLLTQEATVYLGKEPSAEIQKALFARLGQPVNPGHIQSLLTAIHEGQEAFGQLGHTDRQNLIIAVKQAFRHTVGLKDIPLGNTAALKAHANFNALFTTLEREHPEEIPALRQRIERMATLDGMNLTHSMLRRSLNLMRPHVNDKALMTQGGQLANWLDEAIHRHQPIKERLTEHLEQLGEQLHGLNEESRKAVLHTLNRSPSDSLSSIQNAMRNATTGQLHSLHDAFTQLNEQKKGKLQEMLPIPSSKLEGVKVKVKSLLPFIKTEAVKVHEFKERLSQLNTILGKAHAPTTRPLTALKTSLNELMATLSNQASGAEHDVLKTYQHEIERLIGKGDQPGTGRLFSLAIQRDDVTLGQKLQEMLRGGLLNDSKLLSQALDTVGELETDSRKIPGTRNADKMRQAIQDYGHTLLKRLSQPEQATLTGPALQHELNGFLNLNKYLHFGARGIALATTMACIGWLVPIVQTKMTKQLTGKDKNPGIASAKKQMDDESSPSAIKAATATATSMIDNLSGSLKASVPTLPRPTWIPPSILPTVLQNPPSIAPSA